MLQPMGGCWPWTKALVVTDPAGRGTKLTPSVTQVELEQQPVVRKQTASDYLNCSEMEHSHAIMEKLSPSRSAIWKGVDAPPL